MKRHSGDDQHGGPNRDGRVSAATRDDLDLALRSLAESEKLKSKAVAALARVRARGDGEAAVGMPVTQHLRWNSNVRGGTVTTIGVITDVAGEMSSVAAALDAGTITVDQAGAIAWPAAKVTAALRRSLDLSLTSDEGWTTWSPEMLEVEVARLLEDLAPAPTDAEELEKAQRQYLHLQPTLDGQGLKFWGQAHGEDAAYINARLEAATDRPEATDPDPDGVLVGRSTRRGNQLFEGLMRILRGSTGSASTGSTDDEASTDAANVTLYAIVDERDDATGAGEFVMTRRGLAPRLTPAAVRQLQADGARRVEVFARGGEIVAVAGRAGHTLDDPTALSDDTTRIIVTVRDRTCRTPGCDRPVEHLHHLIPRGRPGSTDDPRNLAGLCLRCHHHVVHRWRWSGTVGAVGLITWHRQGTTATTTGRLAQRLPRPPPDPPDPPTLDPDGDPIPF